MTFFSDVLRKESTFMLVCKIVDTIWMCRQRIRRLMSIRLSVSVQHVKWTMFMNEIKRCVPKLPMVHEYLTTLYKNIERKGEITCIEQFLLFPGCFYCIDKLSPNFNHSWNCSAWTLLFWDSPKFVLCRWLTHSHTMTPLDESWKAAFSKHCGKRRKCWYQRQKLSFILHVFCRLQILSIWTRSIFCRLRMG